VLIPVFLFCVSLHVMAVAWIAPESASNTSRLRLGWNYAQPDRADMLVLAMAVVVAITATGLYRVGALMVVGAALSQLFSFLIWDAAPDYVLMDGYIWNASDALLGIGLTVCFVGMIVQLMSLHNVKVS
jgi:hypothetical protein